MDKTAEALKHSHRRCCCWHCGAWIEPLEEGEWLICPECQGNVAHLDRQCQRCGARWQTLDEDADGPQRCPACGFVPPLEIEGIGDLAPEQLGKRCGGYSWCGACQALTLNVPGSTYSGQPLSEVASLWKPDRRWHPDYPELWAEHVRRSAQGDTSGYEAIQALEPVAPTLEQLARRFFVCGECGREKFWCRSYTCPRCDSPDSFLIEMRDAHHVSTPDASGWEWTEVHVCAICGKEYKVANASF